VPSVSHSATWARTPTGYAYIEMSTASGALRVITKMNGRCILDRKVSIQLARPNVAGLSPGELSDTIDQLIDESKGEDKRKMLVTSEDSTIHTEQTHFPNPSEPQIISLMPQLKHAMANPGTPIPPMPFLISKAQTRVNPTFFSSISLGWILNSLKITSTQAHSSHESEPS
jgi:hypothetical protein